jgi:hypothetical protein
MIIQLANAVSDDDCRLLTAMYDRQAHLATIRDQTGHPVVYWEQFRDAPGGAEIVQRLVKECLCNILSQLQLADPLYPETVILAAIGAGGRHNRHADNCRQNEQGDWVANHTPQRDVSAIYYLNDELYRLPVIPRYGRINRRMYHVWGMEDASILFSQRTGGG